jgi:membrane protease YdiL (CAAX protease family)
VYKSLIAVLLFLLILIERDGFLKTFSQKGGLSANIRLSSLVAVIGVAVVAVGHFLYRGESFAMVQAPLEVMVLVGIGWSLLNSISEEFIYRGVLYTRLKDTAGASWAIVGQAAIFGIAHLWTKVPLGIPGVILAFLFALSLGWLVRRTESLMAAVFAHFWVDLALFTTVLLRQ